MEEKVTAILDILKEKYYEETGVLLDFEAHFLSPKSISSNGQAL